VALRFRHVIGLLRGERITATGSNPAGEEEILYDFWTRELHDRRKRTVLVRNVAGEWVYIGDKPNGGAEGSPYQRDDGSVRLAWDDDWTDTPIPCIPKGDHILRTHGRDPVDLVIMGVAGLTLAARNIGPVLHLSEHIPTVPLGFWAWRRGYLDAIIAELG
jgi:hypothetical protein